MISYDHQFQTMSTLDFSETFGERPRCSPCLNMPIDSLVSLQPRCEALSGPLDCLEPVLDVASPSVLTDLHPPECLSP